MVKTVKKGSITIFLALILSLILSLVSASIESVRMSAARTQILNMQYAPINSIVKIRATPLLCR